MRVAAVVAVVAITLSLIAVAVSWFFLGGAKDFGLRVVPCAAAQGTRQTIRDALAEADPEVAKTKIRYSSELMSSEKTRFNGQTLPGLLTALARVWDDTTQREAVISELNVFLDQLCPNVVEP